MALFKSLADKIQQKKTELQEKAAERATEIALQKGKEAVIGAAVTARKKIEEALFGDAEREETAPDSEPAPRPEAKAPKRNAPAAKVEAKIPRRNAEEERAKATQDRARAEERLEKDVDDDLAALKRRIAKGK